MRGVAYRTHEFLGEMWYQDTKLPQNANYNRFAYCSALTVPSILENETEKNLGVTLDEVLEIHRDSYLCRLCDMTFLKMSELHQKIEELEYSSLLRLTRR